MNTGVGSQGDGRKPLLIKASHLPSGSLGSKFPESWARPSACLLAFFFFLKNRKGSGVSWGGYPQGGGRVTGGIGTAVSFTSETGVPDGW